MIAAARIAGWVLCATAAALPQGVEGVAAEQEPELTARERWERLSGDERRELRARYERFQRLDERERRELEERRRNLERASERARSALGPEERARLRELPAHKRAELLGELVREELSAAGRRLRAKLPEDLRARIESVPPHERRRLLEEFKRENRGRMTLVAIVDLGRKLGLAPEDVERLRALPEGQRIEKVLELRKLLNARSIEEHGLPQGLSPERWAEIERLQPRDFFEEALRFRESGRWRGEPGAGAGPDDGRAIRGHEVRRRVVEEILRVMHVAPREHLELAEEPPGRRRAELEQRRRERVFELLARSGLLPAEELAELEGLSDGEFAARVRGLIRGVRMRPDEPFRRGPPPGLRPGPPGPPGPPGARPGNEGDGAPVRERAREGARRK